MRATIITNRNTNDIIMGLRAVFLTLMVFALSINLRQLSSYLAFSDYAHLAEEISGGRFRAFDVTRLTEILSRPVLQDGTCRYDERRILAILALYRTDLLAVERDISPFEFSADLELQIARARAMRAIQDVLLCAPYDGDMWLRLAFVSRAMRVEPSRIDSYVAWSQKTSPNEGWVKIRREQHFRPDLPVN